MSGENYVQNKHNINEFNSISLINLEQSDDETDYEDDPIYDNHCFKQPGVENNLTDNLNLLNYIQNDAGSTDQQCNPPPSRDSDYDDGEYNFTRQQYIEEKNPSEELKERLTILEKSQYLALNSNENKLPPKSFTGVIRKKIKKLFSREKIKRSLLKLYSRNNIKRSLSDFIRVIGSNGDIYYEYVGDKTKQEEASEPFYDLVHIDRPVNLEEDDRECTVTPELPQRVVPARSSASKLENDLKQEYYENIIETKVEIDLQNQILPKLPPRTPLSIPYPPDFEITLDGHLTKNVLYKILLPTISPSPVNLSTIKSKYELDMIFQYEILLSLKPKTTFIYQNVIKDLNYFYYKVTILFKLPLNMQLYKPTISKLISISETNINYKILLFLKHLPDSNLYHNLSKTSLSVISNSSTSDDTELFINMPYNQKSKIKSYLYTQLPLRDTEKGEFDVIILSFKLPPNTPSCNDIQTNLPGYYKLPRTIYSFNNNDCDRKSLEYYTLPQNNSSCNDLESKSLENYKKRKQISLENDNLDITNKLSLNYEITLPPHIFVPHSKIVNRELPPTPSLSPVTESFLSKSLKSLNRFSFLSSQYEPIYEDISNFYHEIRYRNSLFVPHNDYLYGITGETLYDQIPAGNGSDISDITYDPVRWSMAKIDKKSKPMKFIFELLWTLICTSMYIVDVGSDMSLALRYWSQGESLYCGLTLSLVYLASTVDVLYCIYRFIIMFLINLRGVSEYVNLMKLEYRIIKISFENKEIQRNLQLQRARVAALNSYEGIFEACPQLVLQLYLILSFDKDFDITFIMQVITVISSLCACGAAFVNMEKGLRLEDYGVNDLSVLGIIVQYLWLSPLTASRLLSVALLLCVAPLWLWLGAVLHLLLGATLYWRINEAPMSLHKLVNACVYGARVFLSPYEPTYVRYVVPVLNTVHALQNVAATAAWAAAVAPCTSTALIVTVCTVNLIAHALGLLFAVLFHKYKRRFYTFHKVTIVDYGYAVVQIV